jgi:hypothetical protein
MKLEELYRIRLELNGAKPAPAKEENQSKVKKQGFPVPSPSGDEDENKFISRCISEIIDEYGQEQAAAICYTKWGEK